MAEDNVADIEPFEVTGLAAAVRHDRDAGWPIGDTSLLARVLPGGRTVEVPLWVLGRVNTLIGYNQHRITPKGFISPAACRAALRNWAACPTHSRTLDAR